MATILGSVLGLSRASAPTTTPPPRQPSSQLPSGGGTASGSTTAADAGANVPESPTVQITLKTVPGVNASVTLGKTRLGSIGPRAPLVLERRRDSGPLDLVIHAAGFVTVHTRAYTFDNSVLEIRLTRYDKKNTLYGYREPIPPEEDAGVGPPAPVPPP